MSLFTGVIMIAIIVSMTCALPGTFLVLRHQSLLVDAMSHAILPGIVLGVIFSGTIHSPLLIVLAALMGLLVVIGAHLLAKSGLVTGDANQGLFFPALFALGVLLLSTILSSVHVCEDTVLTGDINLNALPSEHIIVGNYTLGPFTFWKLLIVFLINLVFILVCYRVLKLSIFDPNLARVIGMPTKVVEWILMFLVSLTVVVSFDAAGAILVVALVVVPPAAAWLFAHSLPQMIILTQVIAIGSALLGFFLAYHLDLPTSAMMAVLDGVVFLVFLTIQKLNFAYRRRRLGQEARNR